MIKLYPLVALMPSCSIFTSFCLWNPSWSREKRDPEQWLHHRCLLPGQYMWGCAREYSRLWFELHQACAKWEATGQCLQMHVRVFAGLDAYSSSWVCFPVLQPQTLQLDFLMKILPNYHHLKKTAKGNSTPVRTWRWTHVTCTCITLK